MGGGTHIGWVSRRGREGGLARRGLKFARLLASVWEMPGRLALAGARVSVCSAFAGFAGLAALKSRGTKQGTELGGTAGFSAQA